MSNKEKWHDTEIRIKEGEKILIGWEIGGNGFLCDKNWNRIHTQGYQKINIYNKRSTPAYTISGQTGASEETLFTLKEYVKKRDNPN